MGVHGGISKTVSLEPFQVFYLLVLGVLGRFIRLGIGQ